MLFFLVVVLWVNVFEVGSVVGLVYAVVSVGAFCLVVCMFLV